MVEWCCCICLWLGMEFEPPTSPSAPSRHRSRRDLRGDLTEDNHSHALSRAHSRSVLPHAHLARSAGDLVHIPGSGTITIKRASSLKSDRLLMASAFVSGSTGRIAPMSPTLTLLDDILPPPPLPPHNSVLRKQVRYVCTRDQKPFFSLSLLHFFTTLLSLHHNILYFLHITSTT